MPSSSNYCSPSLVAETKYLNCYWRKLSENKELGDVDALTRYKAKLKANGVSEAVLNVTARFLFKRMMQEEADLWNKILTNPNPGFNTNENQLLADAIRDRKPG